MNISIIDWYYQASLKKLLQSKHNTHQHYTDCSVWYYDDADVDSYLIQD